MLTALPTYAQKYFWGDDLNKLSWKDHQKYITKTLLEKGDEESISWLMKQLSKEVLRDSIPSLKLSAKSRNFWEIYLS